MTTPSADIEELIDLRAQVALLTATLLWLYQQPLIEPYIDHITTEPSPPAEQAELKRILQEWQRGQAAIAHRALFPTLFTWTIETESDKPVTLHPIFDTKPPLEIVVPPGERRLRMEVLHVGVAWRAQSLQIVGKGYAAYDPETNTLYYFERTP